MQPFLALSKFKKILTNAFIAPQGHLGSVGIRAQKGENVCIVGRTALRATIFSSAVHSDPLLASTHEHTLLSVCFFDIVLRKRSRK